MQRRVPLERPRCQHWLENREPGERPVGHPDRDRPVDLDHRRRIEPGEGAIEQGDLRPVGVVEACRLCVQRGDGRLELVRAGVVALERPVEHAGAFGDECLIPAAAVLFFQRDRSSRRLPRPGPRVVQQHQRQQAGGLGVRGQQPVQEAAKPDRLLAQFPPDQLVAAGRREPLVEDEVDDGADGTQAPRRLGGDFEPDARVPYLAFGADQALRQRGFGYEEGRRDLFRRQPGHEPQRERDPDLEGERGVAACEDQPEPVVAQRPRSRDLVVHGSLLCFRRDLAEHLRVDGDGGALAVGVDRLAPGGHHEPAARIGRDAVAPRDRGGGEGLGGRVLSRLQVTEPPGQRRDYGAPFLPERVLEFGAHRLRAAPAARASPRPPREPRSSPRSPPASGSPIRARRPGRARRSGRSRAGGPWSP